MSQGKSSSSRGDVSFIRATSSSFGSAASNRSSSQPSGMEPSQTSQHFNPSQNHPSHPSGHSLQDITGHHQHLHHHQQQHHHHHQPSHRSQQQQQQHSFGQPLQYSSEQLDRQFMGMSGEPPPLPPHTGVEAWTDKEEKLVAELDEAKIRVAQMEKTMRWWSDCTSNWREKWNKARNERNKAREENKVLRVKLDVMAKELTRLKRERKEMSGVREHPKEELVVKDDCASHDMNSQENLCDLSEKERSVIAKANEKESESLEELSEISSPKSRYSQDEKDIDDTEILQAEQTSRLDDDMASRSDINADQMAELQSELTEAHSKAAQLNENLIMMQRKLDEANNTIQVERLENCNKGKAIEDLQKEMQDMRQQLDEKLKAKAALEKETFVEDDIVSLPEEELAENKERHREEVNRLSLDLEDESTSRTTMDRHIMDLRRELERLQSENASEWGKRERLESEKLVLERDNKKLKTQIKDMEEELEKKSHTSSSIADSDIKTLQFELGEKMKELSELKHLHGKIKKAYAERGTELDHHRRRAEQYEAEVRKLRSRVDELKHDLCSAEDEVDNQTNAARRAQRANDELQEQVDSLHAQLSHLQSRLRRGGNLSAAATPRSTSLKSLTLEDSADLADSENDFDDI